jgi:long-chain acyl-CoA synthetase
MGGVPGTFEDAVRTGMGPAWWSQIAPDRPAIVGPSGSLSYGELDRQANQLVRVFRRAGLTTGDGVALLCSNRPEFAVVWAATQRSGLRLTAVNWHLTADEVGYIVGDCEAKAFVAEAGLGPVARDATTHLSSPPLCLAIASSVDGSTDVEGNTGIDGFESFDRALAAEPGDAIADPCLGTSMLYTSGTTGRPKGVSRPADPDALVVGLIPYGYDGERHAHLGTGPLYHAAPFAISLTMSLTAGVPLVLMPSWDAEECLRLIDRHRVSHTHMVPTMFHRLLALPPEVRARYDVSSMLAIVHGAAPCPVAVKEGIIEWFGPIVFEYYAATEGAGTLVDSHTWLRKRGTVGKPVPDDQIRIGDDEAHPLPANEIGIVWLKRSSSSPFEYFNAPDKTADSYRGNYYTLGDMGYVDDDGYLFLTDRTANLIISGGVNIYPAEVDAVLLEHPAVGDAATIGIPDDEWGESVIAIVELQDGAVPDDELAAELVEFCRARLAHFKCPRVVEFVDELPRQDNGKIYKRRLRDLYRTRSPS